MPVTNATPPVAKVRYGAITSSIWENRSNEGRVFYNFTLARTWRDDQGTYHDSTSFQAQDAMALKMAIDDSWRWIQTQGRERARQQGDPDDATAAASAIEETPF